MPALTHPGIPGSVGLPGAPNASSSGGPPVISPPPRGLGRLYGTECLVTITLSQSRLSVHFGYAEVVDGHHRGPSAGGAGSDPRFRRGVDRPARPPDGHDVA